MLEAAVIGITGVLLALQIRHTKPEYAVYLSVEMCIRDRKRGSYVYDTIKKENLFRLDEVSSRYFSETVLQLTRALASSQEQLPYPECRE